MTATKEQPQAPVVIGFVVLVMVLIGGLVLDRLPLPPRAVTLQVPSTDCETSPPTVLGKSTTTGTAITFKTNGALRLRVCTASVMSFDARGTEAAGNYARLVVAEGGRTVIDTAVAAKQHFSIAAKPGTWVVLAFPNDLYRPPQDRNLYISKFHIVPTK